MVEIKEANPDGAEAEDEKQLQDLLKNVTSLETEIETSSDFKSALDNAKDVGLSLEEVASAMKEADEDENGQGDDNKGKEKEPLIDTVDLAFLKRNEKKEKHDFSPSPAFMPPPPPEPPAPLFNPWIAGLFGLVLGGLQIRIQQSIDAQTSPLFDIIAVCSSSSYIVTAMWVFAGQLESSLTYPYVTFVLHLWSLVAPAWFKWTGYSLEAVDPNMAWITRFILWGPLVYNILCLVFARVNHDQQKEWRRSGKKTA